MTRWLGAVGLIFSLVGLVSQGTTSARTPRLAETGAQDNVTGIDRVRILVEELNQDAARCGLSDDVVRLAAAGGFLKDDVTVSAADKPVTAAIRIDTVVLENTNECASDYRISLMALAEEAPSSSVESVLGLLTVEQGGGVLFSARGDHRARLTLALSETAKDLATKSRLANQPAPETTVVPAAPVQQGESAYRIARCQELLGSPELVPLETRVRDLRALKCHERVDAP